MSVRFRRVDYLKKGGYMSKSDRELFRAAVFVIIRDEAGRVLLQRRANTGYLDGHYDFPSGHVDAGEGFTTAATRETLEETGLAVDEEDLKLKHANINHSGVPYINIVFETEVWAGEPRIMEPEKCDDMGFYDVSALPEKCSLAVRYVERAGFDTSCTTSYVNHDEFKNLLHIVD